MSTYPTGSWRWNVLKPLSYSEEATPGTLVSAASSWIGVVQDYDMGQSSDDTPIPQSASVAMREILPGTKTYDISLTWIPSNSTFAKYGVNVPVGTGTIAKTFSLVGQTTVSSTAEYLAAVYCVPKKFSMKWTQGKPLTFKMDIAAKSKAATGLFSTVDPIGTGTWATDPATASWGFATGGLLPFAWGAANPNAIDFNCDVDWGTKSLSGGGDVEPWANQYTQQTVTGSVSCYWEDLTYLTDFHAQNGQDLVWDLSSGSALTLTGAHLNKAGHDIPIGNAVIEKYNFLAETAALT